MLREFLFQAFGVSARRIEEVPLYQELLSIDGNNLLDLVKLKVICYAKTTWLSHLNNSSKFIEFCVSQKVDPFPLNDNFLQLFIFSGLKMEHLFK